MTGYPVYDGSAGVDREVLHRIFGDVYGTKRLQPGQVRALEPEKREFTHDCSTLTGNSGSCVLDLETNAVVGLHRGGRYLHDNFAIALPQLEDDAAVKKAAVAFS